MPATVHPLDGQTLALAFNGAASADLFTLDVMSGAVTSAYFSDRWCQILEENVLRLFPVTTDLQRRTPQFLGRLVAVGLLDGAAITASSSSAGNLATFTLSPTINTTLVIALPHSIGGSFSVGQAIASPAPGGATAVVEFSDIGLRRWPGTVDPAVLVGNLVAVEAGTGRMIKADRRYAANMPAVGIYAIDSTGAACTAIGGPTPVSGTYGAGVDLYVGIDGNAEPTSTEIVGQYSQFVGTSASTSQVVLTLGDEVLV